MAQIQSGATSDLLTIDPTFKALRFTLRPPEVTGAYRLALKTGAVSAGTTAGQVLFAYRYTGSGVAILTSLRIGLNVTTAYTAGSMIVSAYAARSYSATE